MRNIIEHFKLRSIKIIQLKKHCRFFVTYRLTTLTTPIVGEVAMMCLLASFINCGIVFLNIFRYWVEIVLAIESIFNLKSDFSFSVINVGNLPIELIKPDRYLSQLLLASSKNVTTRKWLSNNCPSILD